ncbi:GDSL-type esterase/lipase family protein [Serpentinicella sp. ANB-PHB4]|uniref:GDSL-type esterase/lipase family protein n=1 Tax=Serpentinicella sp. ANB-PHB4 TaxID=3074076 RepID=UPI00285F9C83|nr:GDSL-type esterase/lipase family protein [Serpentinicella sp. ANB-PHB4]MDR5658956.1 GDSL-type esterase/lipase family protein [Serpentinicella sp. ANB-PHB4]
MSLVCIGDSLTYGFGVKSSQAWVNLIEPTLGERVFNRGINGDTTEGMVSRFKNDVIFQKPTEVIIMGGSNDFIMGISVDVVCSNIEYMVRMCNNNGITPIIGIQPQVDPAMANKYWSATTDFISVNDKIESYRNWVLGFTKDNNIKYIDIYAQILNYLAEMDKKTIFTDGVHLTPKGHEIVVKTVKDTLKTNEI